MNDFPTLYSSRLKLRKIQVDDIPLLVQYGNNKKVSDYILNIPYPYLEPDAVFRISYVHQGFKANTRFVFAIALKETNGFIGEISLHLDNGKKIAELGYWIGEPLWQKGYTTEAIQTVLKFGFEKLQLDIIIASCKEENIASIKVLEKNNFIKNNITGSIFQYCIKKQEYELAAKQ